MAESQPDSVIGKNFCGISNLRRFRHDAMAATFDIFIVHENAVYAAQAAQAAFEELGRIEANLSRFVENSDIARVNSLGKGRPLQIGLHAFECLKISIEMYRKTNGAFDITFCSQNNGSNFLKLNESEHTIELAVDGIEIDLGAIGKGYAADKMGQLLGEWGVYTALVSAGKSTILPIGVPRGLKGWPLTLSDPADYSQLLSKIYLADMALSASGINKGGHIINPRSGRPVKNRLAAWSTAKTAAAADSLSTAFMVMPLDRIRALCKTDADTSAFIIMPAKKTGGKKRNLLFGDWDRLFLSL